jgi:hypothetical protein
MEGLGGGGFSFEKKRMGECVRRFWGLERGFGRGWWNDERGSSVFGDSWWGRGRSRFIVEDRSSGRSLEVESEELFKLTKSLARGCVTEFLV